MFQNRSEHGRSRIRQQMNRTIEDRFEHPLFEVHLEEPFQA
jgi:hypothetical protein